MPTPNLSDLQNTLKNNPLPPLEKWTPSDIVPFDIVIKDNGDWLHEGAKNSYLKSN